MNKIVLFFLCLTVICILYYSFNKHELFTPLSVIEKKIVIMYE